MEFLSQLNIKEDNSGAFTGSAWLPSSNKKIESYSPVDGKLIASVNLIDRKNYDAVVQKAQAAFLQWRLWPAPRRGDMVRQIGEALRENKLPLGKLVSYEMGKSLRTTTSCVSVE